jgi:putative salt-induced outer membrane protein
MPSRTIRAVRGAFAGLAVLALASSSSTAQDSTPDTARALRITASAGFLDASGNTDVTTLNVTERLEWVRPLFLWQQTFEAVNGSTDGEESASLLATRLRGDWTPEGRLSVYGFVSFDRNRFAGISRRFEEGAGLAYRLVERTRHLLTTELGSQLVQQRSTDDLSDEFLAGRAAAIYRFTFRENSYFDARTEYLPNFETSEDYRLNADLGLVAPLSRRLGIKLGYIVRFDNLPQPGAEKTDRFFTTGVQVAY